MDAFFAAVEQLDFPEYRGKPVIVGADPQNGRGRGVVSTASYEARKFGIHSAQPISQAFQRCPHGIFVRPRGGRYSEMSRKIMEICQNFSPVIEQLSIDEAFLDISGSLRLLGAPLKIGGDLKQQIQTETQLTASVGIAPNKFIAKIASDLKKPDGLVLVEPGAEKTFLAELPISRMWGIGRKSEPIFRQHGLNTIGDLANAPVKKLIKLFGKSGLNYWQLANGNDNRPVEENAEAKSVSQEITFMEDTNNCAELENVLFHLSESLGRTIRQKQLKIKTITLKIRLSDFSTFTRAHSLARHTNQTNLIRQTALTLFRNFDCQRQKVRLIGIGLAHFQTVTSAQLDIFDAQEAAAGTIDQVIDLIEHQFGTGTIKKARLMPRPEDKKR
jgi:nucleotidyltransferase/DNA polymerase involved in DNA repair